MRHNYFKKKRTLMMFLVSLAFMVSSVSFAQTITIGTGTLNNSTTSYPAPYGNYWWGAHHQFLVLASEMQAAGAGPGFITSLGFDVVTAGGAALSNFEIKIGATTQTALTSSAITGLTSVHLSSSYWETTGWNTHAFSSNYLWDGVSNIVLDVCFNNGSYTTNAIVNQSTTSFVSSVETHGDNSTNCTNNSLTNTYSQRPNIQFGMIPSVSTTANLGMNSWVSPVAGMGLPLTATEPVTVSYKNWGTATQNSYTLAYTIDGGANWVSEVVTTPIAPDSSLNYTFNTTADFSASGVYNCGAAVYLAGDSLGWNDTILGGIQVMSIATVSTFPYFTDFEGGTLWTSGGTSNSWQWGMPSASTINSSFSGTACWTTNLTGNHNSYEDSWVESPNFDFTSLTAPVIEFKFWVDAQGDYYDGACVEYTTDGGITWTHLGPMFGDPALDPNGTNWYNNMSIAGLGYVNGWSGNGTGWESTKYVSTALAGEASVKFRVRFGSDNSTQYNGFAFDDVWVYQLPDYDVAMMEVSSDASCIGAVGQKPITVQIKNNGVQTQTNYTLSYSIDGGANFVTESLTYTLNTGDVYDYTFTTLANFATTGIYDFVAVVITANDQNTMNDTLYYNLNIQGFPLNDDLEAWGPLQTTNSCTVGTLGATGNSGWTQDQMDGGEWRADVGGTGSSSTGPSVDYNPGTSSGIYLYTEASGCYGATINLLSPCLDLSTTPVQFSFAYHMYGGQMGSLHIDIIEDTVEHLDVWTMSGDQGDQWYYVDLPLLSYTSSNVVIRIRAITGSSYGSDIAVDDLQIIPLLPDDAGVAEFVGMEGICEGVNDITVAVKNFGTNTIYNVDVDWSINGTAQTTYVYTDSLVPNQIDTIVLGSYNFISNTLYDIEAWTSMPNGVVDPVNGNDMSQLLGMQTSLSGNFTIGATGDFLTFADALAVLNTYGVCAPVVFNVEAGTYTEQITMGEIIGASSVNTITFQSLSGNPADVIVQYAATGTADNWVWRLDGSDYVTIQNMTIKSTTSGNYGCVFDILNGANYNTLHNNIIQSVPVTSSYARGIYQYTGMSEFNTYSNNKIQNGYYGLYLRGTGTTSLEDGNVVVGNEITGYYYYGLYSYYEKNIVIDNNYIENGSSTANHYPGYMGYNDRFQFTNNKVIMTGSGSQYGVRVYYCDGDSVQNLFANNMISQYGSTGTAYGIYPYNSTYTDYVHNSVYIADGSSTAGRAIYVYGSSSYGGNNYVNNNFINTGGGYAMYINSTGAFNQLDYNNLFTSGTTLGYYSGYQADIIAWQTATTQSANSISVDPGFPSVTDLHVYSAAMNDMGTPWPTVVYDIDGELRDSLTPDIGADEFTPAPYDLGISMLNYPISGACYDSTELVEVTLTSYGTDPIDFSIDTAYVHVIATGYNPFVFPVVVLDTGIMAPGSSMTITIANDYNMYDAGTYVFDAYTVFGVDGNALNDAMATVSIESYGLIQYPYEETFETTGQGGIPQGWDRNPVSGMYWSADMDGTGSSNTGPEYDHTTGTNQGMYMYMETSSGSNGDWAYLYPPCADLSHAQVQFWYHMYGATMGTLEVQNLVNGTWTTIWSISGQQHTSDIAPWTQAIVNIDPLANGLRFAGQRGSSYTGDMALDDIMFIEPFDDDVEVTAVWALGKVPIPNGSPTMVGAVVRNWGLNPQDSLNITLSVTGANPYSEVIMINLPTNTIDTVVFTGFAPNTLGFNDIVVSVPADENTVNDIGYYYQEVTNSTFAHADTSASTNSLGWSAGNEGIFLAKYAVNGVKTVEYVNVFIGADNTIGQTVYAVVMDTTGVITGMSLMDTITAADTSNWMTFPIDIPALTVTSNAEFYVGLAAPLGSGAYYPLGLQEEDPCRPDMFYYSGMTGGSLTELNSFGRYMIEAVLGDPPPIEGAAVSFSTPVGACGMTTAETVTLMIQNNGTDTIEGGFTASFEIVGGISVTENVNDTIYPGDILYYAFAQTVDLYVLADSTFIFNGWIDIPGDPIVVNDTTYGFTVESLYEPFDPTPVHDSILYGTAGTLEALAIDSILWYDVPTGGQYISQGPTLGTGIIFADVTYYAEAATAGGGQLGITEVSLNADYIEITNMGSSVFDATGWFVTTSNSYTDINNVNTLTWSLASFQPEEVQYRDDNSSSGTNYWGNNLFYNNTSPGWVLLVNDLGEIADAVFWGWTAADIATFNVNVNGFNLSISNNEWIGDGVQVFSLDVIMRDIYDNDDLSDWINVGSYASKGLYNTGMQLIAVGGGCTSNRIPVHGWIYGTPDYDAGITLIDDPVTSLALSNQEQVVVEIYNYGALAISNFDVSYVVDGGLAVTETYTGTIPSQTSAVYTFNQTVDLSAFQIYDFVAYPTLTGDTVPINDTAFKTVENIPLNAYCPSYATSTAYEELINVSLSNLANYSGPASGATYSDFTGLTPVQLSPGMSYPISITSDFAPGYSTQYSCWVKAYIDWNRDGVYDEQTETAFSSAIQSSQTVTGTIQVPYVINPGFGGMRVVLEETSIATGVVACGTYTWGETEDYTTLLVEPIPHDAGVGEILSPLATEAEHDTVPVEVVLWNYGTDSLFACDIYYILNGGDTMTTAWTGALETFETDTVMLYPDIYVPGGYNTICAYTVLAGDSNVFNDGTCKDFYADPQYQVAIISIDSLEDGCGLGFDTVYITYENLNDTIFAGQGLTANYMAVPYGVVVTEAIMVDTIFPGDILSYQFATPVDLTVGALNIDFDITAWVEHPLDPILNNDTTYTMVQSAVTPTLPIVNDTTIYAGQIADLNVLNMDTQFNYNWFDTSGAQIFQGNPYYTPNLYDTATYFVEAMNGIPGNFIETTYAAGNGSSGNMFDLQSTSAITIDSFYCNINAGSGSIVEVYYKLGTYAGSETNAAAWTLLGSYNVGTTNGSGNPTPVHIGGLNLMANQVYGMYVTSSAGPTFGYTNGNGTNQFYDDGMVTINCGVGVSYPFGSVFTPRVWNGSIFYSSGTGCTSAQEQVNVNVIYADYDAELASIISPISGAYLDTVDITVDIYNNGLQPFSNFTVSYNIDGGALITEQVTNNLLNPGDTYTHTFATPYIFTAFDTIYLCANVGLLNDGFLGNNDVCETVVNIEGDGTTCATAWPYLYPGEAPMTTEVYGTTDANFWEQWWRIELPVDFDYLYVSLCGSSFDTKLEVWDDCSALSYLQYNDDDCGLQSQIFFDSTAGGLLAGTYYVKVYGFSTLSFGDYVLDVYGFGAPYAVSTTVNDVACNGDNTGSIYTAITNQTGTGPYTYAWNTGASTSNLLGIPAGTYSLTVTDSNGDAVVTNGITVNEPGAIITSLFATDVNPLGAQNGIITSFVTGGTPPYTYLWSNGMTSENIVGVLQGNYCVTITDANGCSVVDCAIVGSPAPWIVTPTNVTHTIEIPASANITLDGSGAYTGSWMGVFFDNNGTLTCGGYALYTGIHTTMTVYGADGTTPGFANGENFQWMLWDVATEMEYTGNAQYFDTATTIYTHLGEFEAGGFTGVMNIDFVTVQTQTISLVSGWSIISSYIEAFEPSIDSIFAPVAGVFPMVTGNVTIVKSGAGAVYWPAFGFNGIGNMIIGEGYQVKMTVPASLDVVGLAVTPELTAINIPSGWSIIGYLRDNPGDAVVMLDALAGTFPNITGIVTIVKNGAGAVYWPAFGFNGIGNMLPGEGYQIKLTNAQSFSYPANSVSSKSQSIGSMNPTYYKEVLNTGVNMTLGIPSSAWDKLPATGDEIGVFSPAGELVGSTVYNGDMTTVTIWGDDQYTTTTENISEGEIFTVKLWNSETDVIETVEITAWEQGDDVYGNNDISIAKALETHAGLESYSLFQNQPNPFSELTQIKFYLPEATNITLEVYNILGDKIAEIAKGDYEAGYHTVDFDGSQLSAGSYFYKILSDNFVSTRQMTIE